MVRSNYKLWYWYFSAIHAWLRSKNKDYLTLTQENVTYLPAEFCCGELAQLIFNLNVLIEVKVNIISLKYLVLAVLLLKTSSFEVKLNVCVKINKCRYRSISNVYVVDFLNLVQPSKKCNGKVGIDHLVWTTEQLELITVSDVCWGKFIDNCFWCVLG